MAAAETFDVIVEPSGQDAFTIFAQSMDRTGFAAGTLALRAGLKAEVPDVDTRQRSPVGGNGRTYTSSPPASSDVYAIHRPSGDQVPSACDNGAATSGSALPSAIDSIQMSFARTGWVS